MATRTNPFPESAAKQYLRRLHLAELTRRRDLHDRPLVYFGLPSAEMRDVALWRYVLGRVIAVERESSLAERMFRTAQQLGVRGRMTLFERGLAEVCEVLALDANAAGTRLTQLGPPDAAKLAEVRRTPFDVINLDLCGGFLYPTSRGTSENLEVLDALVANQRRHRAPFLLLLTFQLRDLGADDYDTFIAETLGGAERLGWRTRALQAYYLAEKVPNQPPLLRRLRFCVPVYLHRLAHEDFQVRSLGAWAYKAFYHTALAFEPRSQRSSVLGSTWPPLDELKALVHAPMYALRPGPDAADDGAVAQQPLPLRAGA